MFKSCMGCMVSIALSSLRYNTSPSRGMRNATLAQSNAKPGSMPPTQARGVVVVAATESRNAEQN
jgi:hypothetical protein